MDRVLSYIYARTWMKKHNTQQPASSPRQEGWKAHNLIFAFTPEVKNHNRNDYIVILHRMKQAAADQEKFLLLKTELPS